MATQAFVITFYAEGERRGSDCYGDFVATRSEAEAIGREYVAMGDWMARYTVRRVWLPNDFGKLDERSRGKLWVAAANH